MHLTITHFPENLSVCLTKDGYLPRHSKIKIIQGKEISGDHNYDEFDKVFIGSSLSESIPQGPVTIKEGTFKIKADEVFIGPGTTIEAGVKLEILPKK